MTLLLLEEGARFDPLTASNLAVALWTWIIFLLALVPIWKIVMGPITRALTERDEEAAKAVHAAERASADAEKARAEVEVKLGEARQESAKLLEAARSRAELREREIVENARKEAEKLVTQARDTIRAEQDKAMAAIRNEVVELTIHAAGQVLKRNVDSDDDRRLARELVTTAREGKA